MEENNNNNEIDMNWRALNGNENKGTSHTDFITLTPNFHNNENSSANLLYNIYIFLIKSIHNINNRHNSF